MKTLTMFICLNIIILNTCVKLPTTPKGAELDNHYGSKVSLGYYGPKNNFKGMDIPRAGTKPGDEIKPINNFSKEIGDKKLSSGSFNNTAKDATKIINANIARPKLIVDTDFVHEATVTTPVHIGYEITKKKTTAFDKETGEVLTKVEDSKIPILGIIETPKEVTTKIKNVIDLESGEMISNLGDKQTVGFDDTQNEDLKKLKK